MTCLYCLNEKENAEGWHSCNQAQDARARMDRTIDELTRTANGGRIRPEPVKDNVYIGRSIKGMKAWDGEGRAGKDYDGRDNETQSV